MNPHSAERARKSVHVALGSVCLTLPWIVHSDVPVLLLAGIAAAGLFAVRVVPALRGGAGQALHGVTRRSYGEFAFVLGIAATFVLAHGDVTSYVIPVAVLTFADAAAALIGTRFGLHRFTVVAGTKSVEGSIGFFVVAMLCVALPLELAGQPNALAIATIVSTALTVIEASSWDGLDNLLIPIAGGLIVRSFVTGLGFVA
jgi:phytol kinase